MPRWYTYKFSDVPAGVEPLHHFPAVYLAANLELALCGPKAPAVRLPPLVDSGFKHRGLLLSGLLQLHPPQLDLIPKPVQQLLDFVMPHLEFDDLGDAVHRLADLKVVI